jgi:uncharacterized protein YecE (DUF72 family)
MRVRVGTSGFSYAAWKGSFYPKGIKAAAMLGYYALHFPTVEINNTFYRMPDDATLARWAAEVPEEFAFVLKAPRRITHIQRLGESDSLGAFLDAANALGTRLGPVLFQLPPFFKKDASRLADFLARLPATCRAAFEFRHPSWFDAETESLLLGHDSVLALADTDEVPDPQMVRTAADWGYLRLRRADYDAGALRRWSETIRGSGWSEAWVFFKHEDEGKGPVLARRLTELLL